MDCERGFAASARICNATMRDDDDDDDDLEELEPDTAPVAEPGVGPCTVDVKAPPGLGAASNALFS